MLAESPEWPAGSKVVRQKGREKGRVVERSSFTCRGPRAGNLQLTDVYQTSASRLLVVWYERVKERASRTGARNFIQKERQSGSTSGSQAGTAHAYVSAGPPLGGCPVGKDATREGRWMERTWLGHVGRGTELILSVCATLTPSICAAPVNDVRMCRTVDSPGD